MQPSACFFMAMGQEFFFFFVLVKGYQKRKEKKSMCNRNQNGTSKVDIYNLALYKNTFSDPS